MEFCLHVFAIRAAMSANVVILGSSSPDLAVCAICLAAVLYNN